MRIKCAGRTEATIYRMASRNGVWDGLGSVAAPVAVLAGGEMVGPGNFAQMVADQIPHGRFHRIDSVGHFGPFQAPDLVAAAVFAD